MLRACYTTQCRFYYGDPRTTGIRWYFCDPKAPPLGVDTSFGSAQWWDDLDKPDPNIGEVWPRAFRFDYGQNTEVRKGVCHLGLDSWYDGGPPASVSGPPAWSACCPAVTVGKAILQQQLGLDAAARVRLAGRAVLGQQQQLVATSAAISPTAAVLGQQQQLVATSAAISPTAAVLGQQQQLVATSAVVFTAAAVLGQQQQLVATSAAISTAAAVLGQQQQLVATSAAISTAAAVLGQQQQLVATSAAISPAAAVLGQQQQLVATSAVVFTAAAVLSQQDSISALATYVMALTSFNCATIAGTGSTQAAGTVVNDDTVNVTATSTNFAVTLPNGCYRIALQSDPANTHAVAVFPPAGAKFGTLAINASTSIAAGGRFLFIRYTATQWGIVSTT